jgi:hypothetical protein
MLNITRQPVLAVDDQPLYHSFHVKTVQCIAAIATRHSALLAVRAAMTPIAAAAMAVAGVTAVIDAITTTSVGKNH